MLDPDGFVRSWNDGAARLKGYTEDEIVGEHYRAFYTDADVDAGVPARNLERAAEHGRYEDEGWRVREDGTRFWANVTITAIRDEDGALRGFTKVTRDMTEQREYEQELHEERDFTEQVLETVPVNVLVLSEDGELVRANGGVRDLLDVEPADFDAFDAGSWDLYDEDGDSIPVTDWPWTRVVETGESVQHFECQVDVADGDRRWFSINAAPLDEGGSEVERVVMSADDVTDRKERERRLRRESNQTEKLLRTAPIAIAVQDADGDTILANQHAQDALGLTEDEILDEPEQPEAWTLFDDDGNPLDATETPSARVLATGEPVYDEEVVIEPPNADRIQFRVNAAPVRDADGDVERIITTGEDITELRDRERELEQRKAELETELGEILGRISDAFYALDEEWRFTHLNDSAAELMQQSREDLLGHTLWEVFPDAEGNVFWEKFREAMETQESVAFEFYAEALDAWLEFTVYPSDSGLSIYFRDVSERKRQERALRERQGRLNRQKQYTDDILNAIDDLFYLLDESGQLQRWNESLRDVTGYTDEEIASMHALEFFDERDHEAISTAIAEGLDAGETQVEAEILTKEGDLIPYEFVASTLEDPDGRSVLAGIGRDITDRREYERKLETSNERLEQFAYAASHDLQEPLRMVSSYLQLVENRYADALDEDGVEFVEFAVDGADRMRNMIDGLLRYSRVDTRGDPFEAVDLNDVLDDVQEDLQFRIEETDADVEAESLPVVHGDPGQLRQLFQNLLDNAIEYSGEGAPVVRIDAARDGERWSISIRDEGVGIDPEDADRVFEVFQSLQPSTEHSGTGIGLALSERIVERHGGEIWLESTPGEGTTFTFTLPATGGLDE
ncbi:PAS domain-containing protein [Halorubellus sp. JP-L1]|nr:PAS domain-containing protein [Halorubellus sp. JP-L1]